MSIIDMGPWTFTQLLDLAQTVNNSHHSLTNQ